MNQGLNTLFKSPQTNHYFYTQFLETIFRSFTGDFLDFSSSIFLGKNININCGVRVPCQTQLGYILIATLMATILI